MEKTSEQLISELMEQLRSIDDQDLKILIRAKAKMIASAGYTEGMTAVNNMHELSTRAVDSLLNRKTIAH